MKIRNFFLKALIIFCFINIQAIGQDSIKQKVLTHEMSAEEALHKDEIGKNFYPTDPPVSPVRNVAEFDQMEGVLVRYPFGIPVSLIADMSQDVVVTTIVLNASQENTVRNIYTSNGVNIDNCNFLHAASDSYWTRDYGPWFVINGNNEVGICNFRYNRPRPNDDDIPIKLAEFLGEELYGMDLIHTGGNYMTDGLGISVSTDLVWDENPSLSHAQIDNLVNDYLGITTYHVTADPLGEYIKHVDCWGKFLGVDKILIAQVPVSDPRYNNFENIADYFANQTSSYGDKYRVYRVYAPGGPPDTPYTNSLILNKKVYVPLTGSQWDDEAIVSYQQAMPGYEIIGVMAGTNGWENTDALHCRTHGIADKGMLYIKHIPILGDQPFYENGYEIQAQIDALSNEPLYSDSLLIYYKIDQENYNITSLTHTNSNNYTGTIPPPDEGCEISYFLHAADHSGRNANHPYIGAPDPHVFEVKIPKKAKNPVPQNNKNKISAYTSISWHKGDKYPVQYYTVYFGTDNPPTNIINAETTYDSTFTLPTPLNFSTQYFWKIDSHNEYGKTSGNIWTFTVAGPPNDDFETGDFSANSWYFDGDADWTVDNTIAFSGNFSAKSGNINDNQTTSLIINCESSSFNNVSFWKKVSSEQDKDKLAFYVDDNKKGEWSGDDDWSEETFAVSPGAHTLKWSYYKDDTGQAGDDCAYIDFVYFPTPVMTVSAGANDTICEGNTYTLSANAQYYSSLLWTTSGDGTFDDNTIINPVYTPGTFDIENNSVVLTLTAYNGNSDSISDDMILTINPLPDIPVQPQGPDYVDLFYTSSSEYFITNTDNATSYSWSLSPTEAGSFESTDTTITVLWNADYLGDAYLKVKSINDCGESEFSDQLAITVVNTVGVNDLSSSDKIKLFPNPNNGNFEIIFNDNTSVKNIKIYNSLGIIVYKNNVEGKFSKNIRLNNLPDGIYYLRINYNNNNLIFKKIIIQK